MTLAQLEARLTQRPNSPLFAWLAERYLILERIDDAKAVCLSGLEKYPHYATALVVLAKCYAAEHQIDSALRLLRQVSLSIPDATAIQELIARLKTPAKAQPPDPQAAPVAESGATREVPLPAPEEPPAAEIPEAEPANDGEQIVSRTLAEIYAAQNQLVEAIQIFRLLKAQKPELAPKIDERIKELEARLQAR